MISDSEHQRLELALAELRVRVAELNDRDKDDNDDARRSLTVAWCNYHATARVIGLGSSHETRNASVDVTPSLSKTVQYPRSSGLSSIQSLRV